MVNKLTSFHTLVSLDYDALPFCPSELDPSMEDQHWMDRFGDYLVGDRAPQRSSHLLHMKRDAYCEQLCVSDLGPPEEPPFRWNPSVQAIHNHYRHHWTVGHDVPDQRAGSRFDVEQSYFTGFPLGYVNNELYTDGFPIGFLGDDGKAYIYNHVNLEIFIQPSDDRFLPPDDSAKIVRFLVRPMSIHHDLEEIRGVNSTVARISNPIASCHPERSISNHQHTNVSMGHPLQLASGQVLFTYDVIWTVTTDQYPDWRYYAAFYQEGFTSSIVNSVVVLLISLAALFIVLSRVLRQSVNPQVYVAIAMGDQSLKACDKLPERGWKAVAEDVFRPPSLNPMLLAVCCGTGAQLFFTLLSLLMSIYLGLLEPTPKRRLVLGGLRFYVLFGTINGYVTARFLKTFQCVNWPRATVLAAFGFPSFVLVSLLFIKTVGLLSYQSTLALHWVPILYLLLLFGVAAVLMLFGAYVGYRQDAINFPVAANNIPRPIPRQPWYCRLPFVWALWGILPFYAMTFELFFLMSHIWYGFLDYKLDPLPLVVVLTFIVVATWTIVAICFQLQREDYHWWWRSFFVGGSVAIYFFIYSVYLFQMLPAYSFSACIVYFGYMSIISIGLFLVAGFVGLAASFWFLLSLYMIKRHLN
jgi:transmembrane 9 superfamily member 2/4